MKKTISLILSLVMLLSLIAGLDFSAYALSSGTCGSNLTYTFDSSTGTLTISGTGTMTSWRDNINESLYYENCPFYKQSAIENIIINEGVTSIGDYAFYECAGLTSITIPNTVTSIGNYAFYGCRKLPNVTIPEGVTNIGSSAFENCTGLTSVTIPDSYLVIGAKAFYNTGIYNNKEQWDNDVLYIGSHLIKLNQNISGHYEIKAGTKDIAGSAFYGCTNLQSVSIPDGVVGIGGSAFNNCTSLTSITIPNSVKSIGNGAFYHCTSLTSVTIGNSVTSIDDWAFCSCTSLTSITIPNSVTSIGDWAFRDCFRLRNITIPNSVTNIGACAFLDCENLTSVTIPDSVTRIDHGTFSSCGNLTSVTIPNSVTSIDKGAFYYCTSLTSVTIPDSVISIGDSVFENCTGLKELTMPCSAKIYNSSDVFKNCTNIEKVILTKGTGIMQNYTFYMSDSDTYYQYTPWYISRTKCKDIILDNGITNIGNYAFYNCTGLTSITIPNGVTNIGTKAFNTLTDVTIPASAKIDFSGLDECVGLIRIHLTPGTGTMADWSSDYEDSLWYKHKNTIREINLDEGISNISDSAFHNCSNLIKTNIPNSVVSVGRYAYYGCSNLREITILSPYCTIPNNANVIDEFATIYGYTGSTAEAYAMKFDRDFVSLGNYCEEHTVVIDDAVAATCTSSGLTQGSHCSVCGTVLVAQTAVPATGHKSVSMNNAVAPTCTTTGKESDTKCSTCGVKLTTGKTIPAKGHKCTTKVVKPTYAAKGYTLHTCSVCRKSYKDKYTNKLTVAKPTILKVTSPNSKQIKVTWDKKSYTGYQVQIATDSKFIKNKKSATIESAKAVTKTFAGLKGKTKYYVRVRAYKTYNGKNYYSDWSTVKIVKTKK